MFGTGTPFENLKSHQWHFSYVFILVIFLVFDSIKKMLSLPRFAAGVSIPGAKSTNLGGNSETRYSMSVVFIYTLVDQKNFFWGVNMRSEVPPPLSLSVF